MLGSRIETGELTELAARNARRELHLHPRDLPRLAGLIVGQRGDDFGDVREGAEASGFLATDLRFDAGPEGFPRVHMTITGNLTLECQRCLRPVAWPVEIFTSLTVLTTEIQSSQLDDPFDSVLIDDDGLNMQLVVEDEVLAAMPMAPTHGSGSECAESGAADLDSKFDYVPMHRPFADLASKMGRPEQSRDD